MESRWRLWLVDCLGGFRSEVNGGPFRVGGSTACDLWIEGGPAEMFRVIRTGEAYLIQAGIPGGSMIFDGQPVTKAEVADTAEHTLVIEGHPFAIRRDGEAGRDWFSKVDASRWWIYRRKGQQWLGPVARHEVPSLVSAAPGEFITLCYGMSEMGFYVEHVVSRLGSGPGADPLQAEPTPVEMEIAYGEINTEYGEFTCPVCWFRFDRGDVMSIAVHANLRGDPVLGEEHMQRFLASRFNDRGQALDAMGLAAPEIACPHCRRKLPPGFLDQPHHIFSIVGAPTSGKSYYLSVLVKLLQSRLFKDFGVTFRDAAPSENAVLNDMKRHLFSAATPEEAYLAKTDLEGALYESLPRQGRQVRLPKPFVFRISQTAKADEGFSLVFYDNAGEHFEPGRNSADSPGAQHIAVASGVLFLFDPLFNTEFRKLLKDSDDPQLQKNQPDQQDVILSESEVRMKEILGLAANERVSTPLAVIAGKSDAWLKMLGDAPLLPAVVEISGKRTIDLANLRTNSDRIRSFLLDICPAIVANAEAISSEVCYFAASPLGHPPVKFTDNRGIERIGPDPKRLCPSRVEDAPLWILAKIAPALFPSRS